MTRRAAGQAGFSLLELMVSMSLMGLLALVAVSGLQFSAGVWDRGGEQSEALVETRLVQKFLTRLVSSSETVRLRSGARDALVLFEGSPDELVAATRLPGALSPPGLQLISLSREGETLLLRWTPVGERRPVIDARAEREVLLSGVEGLAFRYFGLDPETSERKWTASWRGRDRLPERVEISVDWSTDDLRRWAPVIARPGGGL